MNQWLVKSEPSAYSWDALVKDGRTNWYGVRNPQATANLKGMKTGDRVFFYHSNEGLEIVGIADIVREFYPDPADKSVRFGMVEVKPVEPLKKPVTLAAIKAEPKLAEFALVRQSRLSVMPVSAEQWKLICKMGDTKA